MHRSKLKNIYDKYRTVDNWANYKRQRNSCVDILRVDLKLKNRKLNVEDLPDNWKFWKTIKPFFSNKGLNSDKLMPKENNRLIKEEKELPTVMNTFFVNIAESLDLKKDHDSLLNPIYSENVRPRKVDYLLCVSARIPKILTHLADLSIFYRICSIYFEFLQVQTSNIKRL